MQTKKRFTPEQKVIILRELLENKLSISQVAEKYGIHVNDIYAWKKKLFENAALIFANSAGKPAEARKSSGKVEQLEEKLRKRDEAISFLLRENIEIKKNIGGDL
ncbi:MAG: transposase [Ignavibacteriales bacterium UTCHB3]|jgi:Transposase.|nr:MAG: transposase [Candidatus Methanoperedens sp.]OQY76094.1 MAG: transposase [Ignavibacteriales bacterium UTCHB3]WKZ71580.1 MAG: transposase [Ignavibacteriaceae bacterium]WKZ73117.1 MAG: transposase [Ignavibacteriaceae bacterium]